MTTSLRFFCFALCGLALGACEGDSHESSGDPDPDPGAVSAEARALCADKCGRLVSLNCLDADANFRSSCELSCTDKYKYGDCDAQGLAFDRCVVERATFACDAGFPTHDEASCRAQADACTGCLADPYDCLYF